MEKSGQKTVAAMIHQRIRSDGACMLENNKTITFEILINDNLSNIAQDDNLQPQGNESILSILNDFEDGEWRYKKFQNFIWDNIKETALSKKERDALIGQESTILQRCAENLRLADTGGEIAEIILYGIMKQYYGALPIVPKIYYKQNKNDEAKGADSVHIIIDGDSFTIWFGECKFYNSIENCRLGEVVQSVLNSLDSEKIRKENSIVTNIRDLNQFDEVSEELESTILEKFSNGISIDDVKPILNIPILLLHECNTTNNETIFSDKYKENIKKYHTERATEYFKKQISKCSNVHLYREIKFHLILFPVPNKTKIVDKFIAKAEVHKE